MCACIYHYNYDYICLQLNLCWKHSFDRNHSIYQSWCRLILYARAEAAQKMKFSMKISSVNVTKSAVYCKPQLLQILPEIPRKDSMFKTGDSVQNWRLRFWDFKIWIPKSHPYLKFVPFLYPKMVSSVSDLSAECKQNWLNFSWEIFMELFWWLQNEVHRSCK